MSGSSAGGHTLLVSQAQPSLARRSYVARSRVWPKERGPVGETSVSPTRACEDAPRLTGLPVREIGEVGGDELAGVKLSELRKAHG